MGKTARGLPIWAQWVLPFATGLLGVMGGLIPWLLSLPSSNLQNRIQKANSDMQRVQVIMEIIEKADPEYLPMLDSLIVTIEDVEWRKAMTWIVEAKRKSLVVIRTEVEEEEPPVRIEPDSNVQPAKDPKFDSTCTIIYLKGDSIAEKDARAMKDYLLNARKVSRIRQNPFKYYSILEQDTSWFDLFYPLVKSKTDTNKDVRIYCNKAEYIGYAWRPYYYLKEGRWGTKYREYRNGNIRYDGIGGNDQLRNIVFFNDIYEPVVDTTMDFEDWEIGIVIPPYFLTEAVLESLYLSEIE